MRIGEFVLPWIPRLGLPGVVSVLAFGVLVAGAAACTDYESFLHWQSTLADREMRAYSTAAVTDQRVFALWGDGLDVFDVAPDGALTRRGRVDFSPTAGCAAISDELVAVACRDSGLYLVDAVDPDHPRIASKLDLPGAANDVCVLSGFVLVADGGAGLQVVNVADPEAPFVAGTLEASASARRICSDGSVAYLWTAEQLAVVQVDAEGSPSALGALELGATPGPMACGNGWVFLVDGSTLQAVDASDPSFPVLARELALTDPPYSLVLAGETVFAASEDGIQVIHHPARGAMAVEGELTFIHNVLMIAAGADRMVFEVHKRGFHSYMRLMSSVVVNGPSALPPRTFAATPCPVQEAHRLGHHILIGDCGIRLLEEPRSADPVHLEDMEPWVSTLGFAVDDPLAYFLTWHAGLLIYDLTDVHAPVLLGSVPTETQAREIELAYPYAYLGCDQENLTVVDVRQPSNPTIVGTLSLGGAFEVDAMALDGSILYVASQYLRIIDVSDPRAPRLLATLNYPVDDVAVQSGYAYLPTAAGPLSSGTLGVFDCRDPANPLLIRHVQLPNAAAGFEIEGDRLFVTGTAGVLVFDVSDPGSPLPIGWSTFSCDEVIADNGEIFACSEVGLRILPSPCPGVPLDEQAGVEPSALPAVGKTLGPPVPNPSRRSVTIRLSADVPSGTPAEVVDARGRRIRRLFTGSAGSPGLRWDGRDDRGRKTPSGVYTIVLHTPGGDRSVQLQRLP